MKDRLHQDRLIGMAIDRTYQVLLLLEQMDSTALQGLIAKLRCRIHNENPPDGRDVLISVVEHARYCLSNNGGIEDDC